MNSTITIYISLLLFITVQPMDCLSSLRNSTASQRAINAHHTSSLDLFLQTYEGDLEQLATELEAQKERSQDALNFRQSDRYKNIIIFTFFCSEFAWISSCFGLAITGYNNSSLGMSLSGAAFAGSISTALFSVWNIHTNTKTCQQLEQRVKNYEYLAGKVRERLQTIV